MIPVSNRRIKIKLSKIHLGGIIVTQYRTMEALSDEIKELIHIIKDTPDNDHEKRLTSMLKYLAEMAGANKVVLNVMNNDIKQNNSNLS